MYNFKFQIPNHKFQINSKLQLQMTQVPLTPPSPQKGEGKGEGDIRILVIGIYLLFGAWNLVLASASYSLGWQG
jgi:hypothetical protein